MHIGPSVANVTLTALTVTQCPQSYFGLFTAAANDSFYPGGRHTGHCMREGELAKKGQSPRRAKPKTL
jgi:hypothetical protein